MSTFNIWGEGKIPYRQQADALFNLAARRPDPMDWMRGQQIIPFLGSGVSLSGRHFPPTDSFPELPDKALVEKFANELGLTGKKAKTLLRVSAYLARCVEVADNQSDDLNDDNLLEVLAEEQYPPSGSELARLFANLSLYTAFTQMAGKLKSALPNELFDVTDSEQIVEILKVLGRITKLANPPDALTSIASYYECNEGRTKLWDSLRQVISTKKAVTATHTMLAAAAKQYLNLDQVPKDYLILTTNYDCLMEDALDKAGVNYAVLSIRRRDQKVIVRFSPSIKDAEELSAANSGKMFAKDFYLSRPQTDGGMGNQERMVLILKLHGCLNSKLALADEGVIISDNDYVDYISQMSTNGRVPPEITDMMGGNPFLFLGYSMNDWNVRSVFKTLLKNKRGEEFGAQDYSVMSYIGDYELVFFKENNVTVLQTDLNSYTAGVLHSLRQQKPYKEGLSEMLESILPTA